LSRQKETTLGKTKKMPFLTPMGQRLALSAADYWETSPDFYMIAIVEDYMGTCIQLEDIYLD